MHGGNIPHTSLRTVPGMLVPRHKGRTTFQPLKEGAPHKGLFLFTVQGCIEGRERACNFRRAFTEGEMLVVTKIENAWADSKAAAPCMLIYKLLESVASLVTFGPVLRGFGRLVFQHFSL